MAAKQKKGLAELPA